MLSTQLFWRVFSVYVALTVGTVIVFGLLWTARGKVTFQQLAEERLREDSATLRAVLLETRFDGVSLPDSTRVLLEQIFQSKVSRPAIVTTRDAILWQPGRSSTYWPPAGAASELREGRVNGQGIVVRRGTNDPEEVTGNVPAHHVVFLAMRVDPDRQERGLIWMQAPVTRPKWGGSSDQFPFWTVALIFGILALAITSIIVGRIIGPLATLTAAAQQIAAGEIPSEIPVHNNNEIGTLAAVFNSMNQQLASRIGDLQSERRLLETNRQRLETILDAMFEGVLAVDANERILFANNAAVRLMDLNPTSMLGRPVWEAIRLEALHDVIKQAMSSGGLQRLDMEITRTQSTVAVAASQLPGDPASGVVVVIHDITELRRLENMRRDFVQNVSHELKTPLSSIAAYADTLLEGALEDESCRHEFVQRIADQADRLHRLILDLLALARMDSTSHGLELVPVDVTRVLGTSLDAHMGVAQAKRIQLIAQGEPTSLWGQADEEGLRTIIDNLLDNALNYTPDGGRVTVRWKSVAGRIQMQVEDTGVGIAREHQQQIFQRFYRIDKARSREVGGTGLGLSIVKHLAQAFGGTVNVHSVLGQGSTFTVELLTADIDAAVIPVRA